MRILLAEHDVLVASFLYRGLREHGHSVECVEDAGCVFARAVEDGSWTILDRSEALELPDELTEALAARPGSAAAFDALSPSLRKQLIYQVDSAKRPDTRQRRAAAIADGLGEP